MIELKNITKTYQVGETKTHALKGVTLSIRRGSFLAVVGRSGCGKSTLLNILGGMDTPTSGEYRFKGSDVARMNSTQLARFRNKSIGYVFQAFHLVNELNIVENVALPLGYANLPAKQRRQRSIEALESVGLAHRLHNRPTQLSGGEQQRVAIARAIVNQPEILLADEPTGNLDEQNSAEIMDILCGLHGQGTTLVLVTHDMDIAALAQQSIHMKDGEILL